VFLSLRLSFLLVLELLVNLYISFQIIKENQMIYSPNSISLFLTKNTHKTDIIKSTMPLRAAKTEKVYSDS